MKKQKIFIFLFLIVITSLIIFTKLFIQEEYTKFDGRSKLPSVRPTNGANKDNELKDTITKDKMLEDFDFMVSTIEESSPFWGVMERRQLTSTWERLKLEYREEFCKDDMNIMIFYNKLNRFLNNFQIGHIGVMTPEIYQIYYKTMQETTDDRIYNDAWKDSLLNNKSKKFYSKFNLGAKNSSQKSTQESDELSNQDNNYYSLYKTKIIEAGKIALLQIDSFKYPPNKEKKQKLFNFYRSIDNYENLIIDITKNGGGNSAYWEDCIVLPNLKNDITYNNFFLYRDTPLIRRFYSNQIKENGIDKRKVKSLFNHENAKDYDFLDIVIKQKYHYQPMYKEPLFKGKIWVLTSDKNYSSSEAFVKMCMATGFATLVGKTTSGSANGDPLNVSLPNSGILIRFDAGYSLNYNGTCQFETGTEPDYIVDSNPLKECLSLIKSGKN